MISALVFLLALPLAVQTYGALLRLVDHRDKARGLLTVCLYLAFVVLLVSLVGDARGLWVGWAYVLVGLLHITGQVLLRIARTRDWWMSDRID